MSQPINIKKILEDNQIENNNDFGMLECLKIIPLLLQQNKEIISKLNQTQKEVTILQDILGYQPDSFPLSTLVAETSKCRQTIRSHLLNNYEPEKDFHFNNGKILMNGKTFVAIKEYYANKSK